MHKIIEIIEPNSKNPKNYCVVLLDHDYCGKEFLNDASLNKIERTGTMNRSENMNISNTEVIVADYTSNNIFETNNINEYNGIIEHDVITIDIDHCYAIEMDSSKDSIYAERVDTVNKPISVTDVNSNDICISNIKRKRKLYGNKNDWIREQTKIKRMLGLHYTGYHREGSNVFHDTNREGRSLKPACTSSYCIKSKVRHCNIFEEDDRQSLFDVFWKYSWDEKKAFCIDMVSKHEKKQKTLAPGKCSRRNYSYIYHLRSNNIKYIVCRKMFQNTLDLNEWMVKNWLNSLNQDPIAKIEATSSLGVDTTTAAANENRSDISSNLSVFLKQDHLNSWFDSLAKMPSHYCRQKTNRLYLEGPFNSKTEVYSIYLQQCVEDCIKNPLSRSAFSTFMEKKKLSLYQPREDRCDKCYSYYINQMNDENYHAHAKQKDRVQEELTKDTLDAHAYKKNVFTMDLQAVKLCPVLDTRILYYSMKLKVHHFIVYNLAPGQQCSNYWWDESEGELEASVFTSLIIKHITLFCAKESTTTRNKDIILYSNGCSYQNRNTLLSNALLQFAIQNNIVVEQKFLVEGHTQMPCDDVNSVIERALKNNEIYLPSDYVKLTRTACQKPIPYKSISIVHSDFKDYKYITFYKSIRPGKSKEDPEVQDIRALKYDPKTQNIYFKLSFDDEYQEIPQCHRSKISIDVNKEVPNLYQNRISLTFSKWTDLQKLKSVLPRDVHDFYNNLPHHQEN